MTSTDIAARGRAVERAACRRASSSRPKFDANVYTNAVAQRVADIGDAAVKLRSGTPCSSRTSPASRTAARPETQAVAVNGNDAVYLNVLRVPGGNTLDIVAAVKKAVASLKNLPPGVEVKAIFDQSTFVRTSYDGLKREIVQALILISLVILLFLQNPRAVFIAAFAIPISFAIILIVLYATGQTLNAFTLGGLMLAMGPLVDISVVVLESIHRRLHAGATAGGGRAGGRERGRRSGAGRHAHDRRGAAARDAAERPGEEAVRPAGADGRRRDVRRLPREHAGHAARLPVPSARHRSLDGWRRPSAAPSPGSPTDTRTLLRRALAVRGTDPGGVPRAGRRQRLDGHPPLQHLLPGDRRVDGARLRARRARHLARRTPPGRSTAWARSWPRSSPRDRSSWSSRTSAPPGTRAAP